MIKPYQTVLAFTMIATILLPAFALAVFGADPPPPGPQTAQEVINVLKNFTPWLFGLLLTLAVVFLMIAAWSYLTAGEDTEKANTARRMIFYTVIAIAAAALARAIPDLIQAVTGLSSSTPGSSINVKSVLEKLTEWLFGLLLAVTVLFILYAAFLFLQSGGEEKDITKAKKYVQYAVIALVVAALSRAIVAIVKALLGVGTS